MFQIIDFLIVNPIVNILFVIYNIVGDFGVAIIIFTIIVKLLMWPLIKRQIQQTKLMRKIQPQLVEIRKRCNGNKQMESIQTMDLYKRNNIKPMRSIWTLLIQLPIFFALFLAIRTIATPSPDVNVSSRAYSFTAELPRIHDIIDIQSTYLTDQAHNTYDFQPQLFGIVDLSAKPGFGSTSAIIILAFGVLAAFMQYATSKIQLPKKKKKKGTWKKLMDDAKAGKDPDQNDLNELVSGQMSYMMPLMMLMIILQLQGALVLYYLITNTFSLIQYKFIFNRTDRQMDNNTDAAITRELKRVEKIREAEVIENKKTGTKITCISARDSKSSKSSKKPTTKSKSATKKSSNKNTKTSNQSGKG